MIYYDVQHHGSTQHLTWLLKELSHGGTNYVHVSLDDEQSKVVDFKNEVDCVLSDVSVKKSIPISWCGPSQMAQQINMLNIALKKKNWKYFANLSGSCYPLKSQSHIKSKLNEYSEQGVTSFCYGFMPKKAPFWVLNNLTERSEYSEVKYLRLKLTCDNNVSHLLSNNQFDPVKRVMHRRGVHCTESPVDNSMVLRGLYQHEFESRENFWNVNPYMVGRAWVILSRKQVEWIVSSDFTNELYNQLAQTFEPDETFLPSLLFNNKNPYINELLNNNYRYRLGAPTFIDKDNLIESFSSEAFFSRKLNYSEKSKRIILNFLSQD